MSITTKSENELKWGLILDLVSIYCEISTLKNILDKQNK